MATHEGFFELGDGVFVGKGISAITNSQTSRNELIALFGGKANIPSSVMKAKRDRPTEEFNLPAKKRGYNNTSSMVTSGKIDALPKCIQKSATASGKGCGFGALFSFPQNILKSMVLLYTEPWQTVFDPFAGHNGAMSSCIALGRHYIGCDLSTEFMSFNNDLAIILRQQYPKLTIDLYHVDSRKVPVADNTGDFTITSPPYWNIEFYGNEPKQLGKSQTYDEFLIGISEVMKENFRVLKPGAYAAWFINDFRKDGAMHFYHMDIKTLGEQAGFVAHDIMIVDFGPGIRDCFANQIVSTRIIPKRHEYGVIFRKPLLEKPKKQKPKKH